MGLDNHGIHPLKGSISGPRSSEARACIWSREMGSGRSLQKGLSVEKKAHG